MWNEDRKNLGPSERKTVRDMRDLLATHAGLDGRYGVQIKLGLLRRIGDIIENIESSVERNSTRTTGGG
jgi:hypothetical protein